MWAEIGSGERKLAHSNLQRKFRSCAISMRCVDFDRETTANV